MPTYSYQCFACGHQFDLVQKITEDPIAECPQCKAAEVKRLISASAFHLKGSGWYKTDYSSGGTNSSSSTKSEVPKDGGTQKDTASPPPVSTPVPATEGGTGSKVGSA